MQSLKSTLCNEKIFLTRHKLIKRNYAKSQQDTSNKQGYTGIQKPQKPEKPQDQDELHPLPQVDTPEPQRLDNQNTIVDLQKQDRELKEPATKTFMGIYEDKEAGPITEIEKTLQYPVTIIGTRKPGTTRFFSWDLNVSLIRDRLNPDFFLTFQDASGKVVGPVCYRGDIISWGLKIEVGTRFSVGNLTTLRGKQFNAIPTGFDVESGYDGGITFQNIGVLRSFMDITPRGVNLSPGSLPYELSYWGMGSAFGLTQIKQGEFNRLPYLFKPKWGPLQIFLFWGLGVILPILLWMAVIAYIWQNLDENNKQEILLAQQRYVNPQVENNNSNNNNNDNRRI